MSIFYITDCGANEGNLFFSIYCIRLGTCEDEYLKQALRTEV